ncbi:MAG: aldo/keto reductase [Flavobacteriales bacterium]|nr:aldo/keto reductase [Flavobacteriales bacterium]
MNCKNKLVIGTMKWGSWGKNFNEQQATDFFTSCIELGINHFDLADIYGNYQTEKLFGNALKNSSVEREKIQITSKFGIEYPCENSNFQIKAYNSSKEHFNNSLERSLNEIGTNYIDQYLLHRPDYLLNGKELSSAVENAKTEKKIHEFGVSNFTISQFEFLKNYTKLSTNQIQFSVNYLSPLLSDDFLYYQKNEIPLMVWSPLGNIFTSDNDSNTRIKKVLDKLSKKYNLSYNQLLITFINKLPNAILPIIGTTDIERVKEIQQCLNVNLEHSDWYELIEASLGKRVD